MLKQIDKQTPYPVGMDSPDTNLVQPESEYEHAGFLFSLKAPDPVSQSLLIAGDPGCGKTRQLHAILEGCTQHNSPNEAAIYLVAHQPAQFADIGHLDHCRLVMQTYDRSFKTVVQELVDLAEMRRGHPSATPAVLLAIDDLASALLGLDEASVTLFYWLIRHGPRSCVFTLATLSTRRLADLDLHFLEAFPAHLVGIVTKPKDVKSLINGLVAQNWVVEGSQHFRLFCQSHRLHSSLYEPLMGWRRI